MNAAEQTARIKILNAMGLGPVWLSRYASEEVTPVAATLALADVPPAAVLPDGGVTDVVTVADVPRLQRQWCLIPWIAYL
jgi:hypothetical protein